MPFLRTSNDLMSLILKVFFLVCLVCAGLFFALSVIANFTEGMPGEFPKMPAYSSAPYEIILKATGDILLTKDYDSEPSPNDPSLKLYTLHGFYDIFKNKWHYYKNDFPMDEYFFGPIGVIRRQK